MNSGVNLFVIYFTLAGKVNSVHKQQRLKELALSNLALSKQNGLYPTDRRDQTINLKPIFVLKSQIICVSGV